MNHIAKFVVLLIAVSIFGVAQANQDIQSAEKAKIYPNPVVNGTTLTISADKEIKSVVVLNILGQVIQDNKAFSRTELKIDTSSTEKGLYVVKVVYLDNTEYTERIIIK